MLKHLFAYLFLFSFALVACEDDPMPPPDEEPPAPPQEQQQAPGAPGMGDAEDISDDELESFVEVNIEAEREQVNPQTDPQGFEDVVEDKGLDLEQYMNIHAAIQQDPLLQQEVEQLFQELE